MDLSWLMDKIWIQLLLLVGIALVTVLLTRSTADARHQAVRRVLLVGFVIAAVSAILAPSWLSALAALLGVGRGTDLLLYLLVIAFLSFIATSLRRVKMLDRRITQLTRELALLQTRLERADFPTAHHPGHSISSTTPRPDEDAQASDGSPASRPDVDTAGGAGAQSQGPDTPRTSGDGSGR